MLMARSRTPARYASSTEFRNPKPQNPKFLQICARKCCLCARPCRPGGINNYEALVPKKGLEPPHPCGYMDLNHARLPIPPLRQVTAMRGGWAALKEDATASILQGRCRVSNLRESAIGSRFSSFEHTGNRAE